jgi:hypothetical protein
LTDTARCGFKKQSAGIFFICHVELKAALSFVVPRGFCLLSLFLLFFLDFSKAVPFLES